MNDSIKQQLKTLYNTVFDSNGNVKLCGRTNCLNLIQYIEGITHTSGIYGDTHSGKMNVEKIKEFVTSQIDVEEN